MTETLLVDDHLLLRVLLQQEPAELRSRGVIIATTGLWYHRLCRAVSDQAVVGSMSRRLGDVDSSVAATAIAAVIQLPESIQLLSLRSLGWPMSMLVHAGARLNLLSLEALAAARHLSAEICLADVDNNEALRSAAARFGVPVRSIAG